MSHEIRTPMNGVIGMTELLLDTELTSEQREYGELCRTSATSLLMLVNDILDFSKIEAGKLKLEVTEFGLDEIVDRAIDVVSFRARDNGLRIVSDVRNQAPGKLVGDPNRLRQILVNLLANAVKFTERGEVALHVAAEATAPGTATVHCRITDTGIGFPADQLSSIFSAFTQADGSTTRARGGTGLGLAISSERTSLMGGRIWAESEVDQGGTFHVEIPFPVQAEPPQPSSGKQKRRLDSVSVLVFDPHPQRGEALQESLREFGVTPICATTHSEARSALRLARTAGPPVELITLRYDGSDSDVFALARKITKDAELADTRLMILASVGLRGDGTICRELGVDAYLTEFNNSGDLIEAIRTVLSSQPVRNGGSLVTRHTLRLARRALSVLVAEDNPANLKLVTRLLERRGHSVRGVVNGREAIETLDQESFDVVLMDVQMPEMDGIAATREIRAREADGDRRVPIIALTARAMRGDRQVCLDCGMDEYLAKPIKPDVLFAALEGLLSDSGSPHAEQMESVPG